ncbi:hypothetical protein ACFV7Q_25190, partial [Streptomyces sp. NPDC059851]|uniref:hypothetical protein n=1 Tax=Streptomyces sp. NPDC059851 TaxID=3346971 RepID=UPI00364AF298
MSTYRPATRLFAASGLLSGALIALPALVEAFTGETAVTSWLLGLAPALSLPLIAALHLRQRHVTGRFGEVAFVVNLVGAGLFGGAAFTLNMALFHLDAAVVEQLLEGPTRFALLGSAIAFAAGSTLLGATAIRARVWPRVPSWGYAVVVPLLALLAPLPDAPVKNALHVLVGVTLMWFAAALYAVPATAPAAAVAGSRVPPVSGSGGQRRGPDTVGYTKRPAHNNNERTRDMV